MSAFATAHYWQTLLWCRSPKVNSFKATAAPAITGRSRELLTALPTPYGLLLAQQHNTANTALYWAPLLSL